MSTSVTDTSTSRAICRRLQDRLAYLGMSQAALADELGVTQMWVSRRLTGATPIDVNDLAAMCDALGLSLRKTVAVAPPVGDQCFDAVRVNVDGSKLRDAINGDRGAGGKVEPASGPAGDEDPFAVGELVTVVVEDVGSDGSFLAGDAKAEFGLAADEGQLHDGSSACGCGSLHLSLSLRVEVVGRPGRDGSGRDASRTDGGSR